MRGAYSWNQIHPSDRHNGRNVVKESHEVNGKIET